MQEKTFSHLIRKIKSRHVLLSAQMALTYRCNLDCIHCFESKDSKGELTTIEIKDMLSQLKEAGCIKLAFTGGELFLRKDILEILDFSRKSGFGIIILTNGTLLTKELVRHIKRLNPTNVQISLYGATKKVHELITQVEGSFEKTLQAIALLRAYKLKFKVVTMVMRQNFHEIKILKEMAIRQKWNLLTNYCITPRYNGSKAPLRLRISQSQIKQAVAELQLKGEYCHKNRIDKRDASIYFLKVLQRHCYISAQGEVFLDCVFRMPIGKIKEKSFKEIWIGSEEVKDLRRLKLEDFQCSNCKYYLYRCWGPGLAWLEHGDFRIAPAELCRLMNEGLRQDGKVVK